MSIRRKLVTVVDDDPAMLKAIERLLGARGFEVEAFSSAEAFLSGAATSRVACLVVDIHLGGMSGIELRRRLVAAGPDFRSYSSPPLMISPHANRRWTQAVSHICASHFFRIC